MGQFAVTEPKSINCCQLSQEGHKARLLNRDQRSLVSRNIRLSGRVFRGGPFFPRQFEHSW
jgi:hypothetical protein